MQIPLFVTRLRITHSPCSKGETSRGGILLFHRPSPQHESRVAVGGQEAFVAGKGELAGVAVAVGDIDGSAGVHVSGVVLQHRDRGFAKGAPA